MTNPAQPDEDQRLKRIAEWAASSDAARAIELAIKRADDRSKERREAQRMSYADLHEPCTI